MLWLDNHRAFPRAALPTPRSSCVQGLPRAYGAQTQPWAAPGETRRPAIDRHIDFQNHSVGASGHSDSHFLFQSIMRRSSDRQ